MLNCGRPHTAPQHDGRERRGQALGDLTSFQPEAAVSRGRPSRLRGHSQAGRREMGQAGPGSHRQASLGGLHTKGQCVWRSQPAAQRLPKDRPQCRIRSRGAHKSPPLICLQTAGPVRIGEGAQQRRSRGAPPWSRSLEPADPMDTTGPEELQDESFWKRPGMCFN